MAKTDPDAPRHRQFSTFLVELPDPGLPHRARHPGDGRGRRRPVLRGRGRRSGHAEVAIEDLGCPAENIVGGLGEGSRWASTGSATGGCGTACGASPRPRRAGHGGRARHRAGDVRQAALADRQGIQWMLADCAAELYMTRLMILHIAYKMEHGLDLRRRTRSRRTTSRTCSATSSTPPSRSTARSATPTDTPLGAVVRRGAGAAPRRRPRRGAPLDGRQGRARRAAPHGTTASAAGATSSDAVVHRREGRMELTWS